jgi:hypothetical protein
LWPLWADQNATLLLTISPLYILLCFAGIDPEELEISIESGDDLDNEHDL